MTENILNPHIRMLCRKARNDEWALKGELTDDIFGFHAQQSCEKLLKALISSHLIRHPRTHSLETLTALLIEHKEVLPSTPFDVTLLDPFAVEFRYDQEDSLSLLDRIVIRESIAILREHILKRILDLQEQMVP